MEPHHRVGLSATSIGVVLCLVGCASAKEQATTEHTAPVSAAAPATYGLSMTTGGQYRWSFPRVVPVDGGARPTVEAGDGSDPKTGSGVTPVSRSTTMTPLDPTGVRVRYIHQSWDGRHVVHDSWQNNAPPEPIPSDVAGGRIRLLLNQAHAGDVWELVVSPNSAAAVAGQSGVIVVEFYANAG